MNHELQPYLPGFSPREAAPFKGSEYLVVDKQGEDYYLYLTRKGVEKVTAYLRHPILDVLTLNSESLDTFVDCGSGEVEELQFRSTNDSSVLNNRDCHDGIFMMRDKKGPIILVARWLVGWLSEGKFDELVTRYDGHTNKIRIRMINPLLEESAA